MQTIAERTRQGLPVPVDVIYQYSASPQSQKAVGQAGSQAPITILATTTIRFDHPSQAGNDRWPDFVVQGEIPPNASGFIREGDYSSLIRERMEARVPDIWQRYEFGFEPRTYTFTEEYTISYPEPAPRGGGNDLQSTHETSAELLMGLTVPGPHVDETIGLHVDILGFGIIDFEAGFRLDWGLGLRLPMELHLASESPMLEGSSYWPTSNVMGLNWDAADYTQAGVDPEEGNEFVMYFDFLVGVFLDVFEKNVINFGVRENLDESSSFSTPFGPGATFSLPSIDVTVWSFDAAVAAASIGLTLTPQVGSDKFTSAWAVSGQAPGKATGNGNLVYSDPTTPVIYGPVQALDGPGMADFRLDEPRYYFSQFLLDLGLFFDLDVFGHHAKRFNVPITDFDLSALTGNLYLGPHSGTTDAMETSIAILNVPPTAAIDAGGAFMVNGVPTFIKHVGEPLMLQGRSTDPGLDDLTLSWDWDDGPPAPDLSTTYPVPYDITETQTHVFGDACAYFVRFKAMDDDGDWAEHVVPVVVTGSAATTARFEGYWQHQLRGNGETDYDAEQIACFLEMITLMSSVFDEACDISTAELAFDVLFPQGNHGSESERLKRELLVAWLNFASGAFDYMELLDTDHNERGDTPFHEVVEEAELVLMNPASTAAQLRHQTWMLHHIKDMASSIAVNTRVLSP